MKRRFNKTRVAFVRKCDVDVIGTRWSTMTRGFSDGRIRLSVARRADEFLICSTVSWMNFPTILSIQKTIFHHLSTPYIEWKISLLSAFSSMPDKPISVFFFTTSTFSSSSEIKAIVKSPLSENKTMLADTMHNTQRQMNHWPLWIEITAGRIPERARHCCV